jgi:hypothetical protein
VPFKLVTFQADGKKTGGEYRTHGRNAFRMSENLKGSGHLRYLSIQGMIILKRILGKLGVTMLAVFIGFRTGTGGELLCTL